jgi:hypothetical protein
MFKTSAGWRGCLFVVIDPGGPNSSIKMFSTPRVRRERLGISLHIISNKTSVIEFSILSLVAVFCFFLGMNFTWTALGYLWEHF